MTQLPVSLIVCSRNRPDLLSQAVASVLDGTEVPDELLVMDQSDEPHAGLADLSTTRCTFRYVHSKTVGLSRSRNLAIATAAHPTIMFIDDDVLVPATWFGTIARSLDEAGPRSVVTGRVLASEPEVEGGFAPSLHPDERRVVHEGRVRQDPLATFNVAMPRSAHAAVGGFDERLGPGTAFPAAEDNDFGHRLLEAGFRIVFEPQALVYHRAWRDQRAYVPLRYGYGRGTGGFYAKHLKLTDAYMWRRGIGSFLGHLRRIPRGLVDDRRTALAEVAWCSGFVVGFVHWLLAYRLRAPRASTALAAPPQDH